MPVTILWISPIPQICKRLPGAKINFNCQFTVNSLCCQQFNRRQPSKDPQGFPVCLRGIAVAVPKLLAIAGSPMDRPRQSFSCNFTVFYSSIKRCYLILCKTPTGHQVYHRYRVHRAVVLWRIVRVAKPSGVSHFWRGTQQKWPFNVPVVKQQIVARRLFHHQVNSLKIVFYHLKKKMYLIRISAGFHQRWSVVPV